MNFITVLALLLLSTALQAQTTFKKLEQQPIALKYKIPTNWYIGGVQSTRQQPTIKSAMNVATDYSLSMYIVAAPSTSHSLPQLQAVEVGGYTFVHKSTTIDTTKDTPIEFQQVIAHWEQEPQTMVLRFSATTATNWHYVVYFWGEPQAIMDNGKLLDTILQSMQSVP